MKGWLVGWGKKRESKKKERNENISRFIFISRWKAKITEDDASRGFGGLCILSTRI
ncbi:MAG: hypothetical protein Q8P67_29010 [archaeon]|nr:hypothetical protein [archaeon]